MSLTDEAQSPCEERAAALKWAIHDWVEAADATRECLVKMPSDPGAQVEPFHPGFFRQIQEAHERGRKARMHDIRANSLLYDCMERNDLIEWRAPICFGQSEKGRFGVGLGI